MGGDGINPDSGPGPLRSSGNQDSRRHSEPGNRGDATGTGNRKPQPGAAMEPGNRRGRQGVGTMRCVGRLAEMIAASAGSLSRATGRGGGTSLPGMVLNKLEPGALARLGGGLGGGAVYISATNGKTTTARLLSACLRADGRDVTANAAGANLASGVATALLARRRSRRSRRSRWFRRSSRSGQAGAPGGMQGTGPAGMGAARPGGHHGRDAAAGSADPATRCGGIGVFEVDEGALSPIAGALQPRAVVLMNLFRDQLDRYGELETIAERWDELARSRSLGPATTLVLNADDPALAYLGTGRLEGPTDRPDRLQEPTDGSDRPEDAPAGAGAETSEPTRPPAMERTGADAPKVVLFGIDDPAAGRPDLPHAADTVRCGNCGGPLSHDLVTVGHLGHWRCEGCGLARPRPHISARRVRLDGLDRLELTIAGAGGPDGADLEVSADLGGLHNAYNVTAAVAAATALGVPLETVCSGIAGVQAAFGRAEQITLDDRTLRLLLAKNPTGANENIRCVLAEPGPLHLLVVLNDRTADGRDPSWIWDVDYEPLWDSIGSVTLAGDRCWELALRFSYGGLDPERLDVRENLPDALDAAVAATPPGGVLHVLPTYTAMLGLRAELVRRGVAQDFWHET